MRSRSRSGSLEDIKAGKAMSDAPLPGPGSPAAKAVHTPRLAFSPRTRRDEPRSSHPVLQTPAVSRRADRRRNSIPADRLGERRRAACGTSATTSASCRSKRRGKIPSTTRCSMDCSAWSTNPNASSRRWCCGRLGEPLLCRRRSEGRARSDPGRQDRCVRSDGASFRRPACASSNSLVPVVAAVRGMAFGGGCEFRCTARARSRRWKVTSDSSRRASVCCRPVAALSGNCYARITSGARRRSVCADQENVRDGRDGRRCPGSALSQAPSGLLREERHRRLQQFRIAVRPRVLQFAHACRMAPAVAGRGHHRRRATSARRR